MSKVGEYYRELDELNGTNNVPEPSDEELAEIENKIDNISWEDIDWD